VTICPEKITRLSERLIFLIKDELKEYQVSGGVEE